MLLSLLLLFYFNLRFIRYVRAADSDSLVFITASVWAEMKKTISYKVDASLTADGVVHQSQCECTAGEGPSAHCKHILTLLFGLAKFCRNGDLLTEMTCTQVFILYYLHDIVKTK